MKDLKKQWGEWAQYEKAALLSPFPLFYHTSQSILHPISFFFLSFLALRSKFFLLSFSVYILDRMFLANSIGVFFFFFGCTWMQHLFSVDLVWLVLFFSGFFKDFVVRSWSCVDDLNFQFFSLIRIRSCFSEFWVLLLCVVLAAVFVFIYCV